MSVKRYELDEAQWVRLKPLSPGKASDPGRTGSNNRLFVNGCSEFCSRLPTGGISQCAMASGRRPTMRSSRMTLISRRHT